MNDDMNTDTTIDELDQPALIIDTAQQKLVAANAAGRRIWGLDHRSAMPLSLPADMPALAAMTAGASSLTGTQPSVDLVFWTKFGAQKLRCRLKRLPSTKSVLVIFDAHDTQRPQPSSNEADIDETPVGRAKPAPVGSQIIPLHASSASHSQPQATAPEAGTPTDATDHDARTALDHSPITIDTRAMAHEMRTPLSAIVAFAEMIESQQFGPIGDQRYLAYAKDIGDSARLTLGIVAAALDRPSSEAIPPPGSFTEIDPADLIGRCTRTVRPALEAASISFQHELPDSLPRLIANAPALTQILLNFLANSIKFTPSGGAIKCAVAVTGDGELEISVTDNGVGMTKHDTRVLIPDLSPAPEQSLTESQQKTGALPDGSDQSSRAHQRGIGFSLVRQLATSMGAKIDFTSERGVGTRVCVRFPPSRLVLKESSQPSSTSS